MSDLGQRRPVRQLSEDTVRRIAAGEVVTRPAAAVKELIENSLDAGATQIKLELKSGGKNLIKVSDNGSGMTRDDVRLAVARHATSKISAIDDLSSLATFGFRGEALASIAAVSRMTIETNVDDGLAGTRLEVDGGDIREIGETAHPVGTTITARTLFFNLPARRGFLKSDGYESRLVVEVAKSYAVARPEVGFEVVSNDRTAFRVPSAQTPSDRLAELYDRALAESLIELKVDNPLLSLGGYLAEPSQAKRYYDVQSIFFNHRPVRSRTVIRAVYEGYGPVLGSSNPNFILFIETEPARLDVNVHPTKQEVRFADERFLFDFVSEAVRQALGTKRAEITGTDDFLFQHSLAEQPGAKPQGFWQLHNSYIVAQVTTGYVIVDQHAAHERILFEELTRLKRQMGPQGLLFPISIDLTAEELDVFKQVAGQLAAMGMQAKPFGGQTVVVETVPSGSFMGRSEIRELFSELADINTQRVELESGLATLMACKAAVKAGQRLSVAEMESLFNRLFSCEEPYFCPHGRPTIVRFTLDELARKFGRT